MSVTVELSKRFEKAVRRLDDTKVEAVQRALTLFIADPKHPSLNFEKLKGTSNYTIRATKGFRIVLIKTTRDTYRAIDVGQHDINRTYG